MSAPAGAAAGSGRLRSSSSRWGERRASSSSRRLRRTDPSTPTPSRRCWKRPRGTPSSSKRPCGCWPSARVALCLSSPSGSLTPLQALIAARIDRLPPEEKTVLQRASVIGRTFWGGAIKELATEVEELDSVLDTLLLREFLVPEVRSSISGETAYRFKHVLIREVAYSGLSKSARADLHERFAHWLRERAGEELLEIRAYHLDQAAALISELDGGPPPELASRGRGSARDRRTTLARARGASLCSQAAPARARAGTDPGAPLSGGPRGVAARRPAGRLDGDGACTGGGRGGGRPLVRSSSTRGAVRGCVEPGR